MPDQFYVHRPGIGNVGSYQVAGWPYMSGSTLLSGNYSTNNAEVKFPFPYISKEVTITNVGPGNVFVHYCSVTSSGNVITNKHYFPLSGSRDSVTLNSKCKEIYVTLENNTQNATVFLIANLTNISATDMPILTGSGLTA